MAMDRNDDLGVTRPNSMADRDPTSVSYTHLTLPTITSQSPVAPRISFFGFNGAWRGAFMAGRSHAGGASHRPGQ